MVGNVYRFSFSEKFFSLRKTFILFCFLFLIRLLLPYKEGRGWYKKASLPIYLKFNSFLWKMVPCFLVQHFLPHFSHPGAIWKCNSDCWVSTTGLSLSEYALSLFMPMFFYVQQCASLKRERKPSLTSHCSGDVSGAPCSCLQSWEPGAFLFITRDSPDSHLFNMWGHLHCREWSAPQTVQVNMTM